MSVPYLNSSVTIEIFSLEFEVMSLRFSTLFSEFSSTLVTFDSTSEALAPGYEDITITMLASKSGNNANGVLIREKTPNMAKARNTKAVVTGRFTDDLYMLILNIQLIVR